MLLLLSMLLIVGARVAILGFPGGEEREQRWIEVS